MNGFFSGENPLFRFFEWALDMLVLSLLWLVCCLPIVTIGPSTAALYYSCAKCVRYRESGPYRNFWTSFKENLKTGAAATLVFLLIAGVLVIAGIYLYMAAASLGRAWQGVLAAYCVLALLPLAVMVSALALLSRFGYTLGGLLKDGFKVALQNLPRTGLTAALAAAVVWAGVKFWYFGAPVFLPAVGAWLATWLMEPVLRKYTPEYDPEDATPPEDRPWYLR